MVVNRKTCFCTKFCLQNLSILIHFMKYSHVNNWRNGYFCYKSSNYKLHLSQWNQVLWIRLSNKKQFICTAGGTKLWQINKTNDIRRSINLTCSCRWATLLYHARPQDCWTLLIMCVIRSGSTYFMPGKWCVFNGSHILPSLCNISDRVPVSLATINQHQGLSG